MITQELFAAWLRCETEAFLKVVGTDGGTREFLDWQQWMFDDYKHKSSLRLRANYRTDECGLATSSLNDLSIGKYPIVIDGVVRTERIQARIHALERIPATKTRHYSPYIPIRFVPSQKITKHDKLLLAFDALALFMASGKEPSFGRIIHGVEQKVVVVRLKTLMNIVSSLVERLEVQQASRTPPQLILNRHCVECEFQTRCRRVALEKDELSLLSGMTGKERKRQHDKGIFSVAQLSYTFRPRRKPRSSTIRQEKYHHALKALAIRERTIYVAGRPELSLTGTSVYLDVEGVPDRDSYYLIGLRVKTAVGYVQHSFWANEPSEEGEIWASFVRTLARIENPQLLHYGSYETTFLKRMKERYMGENSVCLDQLVTKAVNLLSVIYAKIYFPTYSNSLKEIAPYLGFKWSMSAASGLSALGWRSKWEFSRDPSLKDKLIRYNAEDCEALECVANTVARLCQGEKETAGSVNSDSVHTDSLERQSPYRFGKNAFSLSELDYINKAAYWSYQRERIYVRSSKRMQHVLRKVKKPVKTFPINQIIECARPESCPKCGQQRKFSNTADAANSCLT